MTQQEAETAPRIRKEVRPELAGPVCLGLFALILLLIDLTRVHPALPGRTGAQQIQQLAVQADRWRQVHGAFTVAGLLALFAVLWLRRVVLPGGLRPAVEIASAAGVVGAVVFSATVFAEVVMIPDLAEACTESEGCLGPENSRFTETFANVGWRVLPGLDYGARLSMAGLASLALIGWGTDRLHLREALPLVLGAGYELVDGTGLHGWGDFRLEAGATGISGLLVLAAAFAIIMRPVWERQKPIEPESRTEPAPSA